MANITNTRIYKEELSGPENKVVNSARSWLETHPDAKWEQENSGTIYKCEDDNLIKIIIPPLTEEGFIYGFGVLKMDPSTAPIDYAGDLLPLWPSDGCSIIGDDNTSYELEFGKKLCIPQPGRRKLRVEKGYVLYLLWILRTRGDQRVQQQNA